MEGGRSYAAVSKDCTCKKMEKKAGTAHDVTEISEIRILRQAKLELEQQLKGKKFIRELLIIQIFLFTPLC